MEILNGWGMTRSLRVGPKFKRDERAWNEHFGPSLVLGRHNLTTLLACVKAQGSMSFRFTFTGGVLTLERIPRDRLSALLGLFSGAEPKAPGTVSGLLEITHIGDYSIEIKKCDPADQAKVRAHWNGIRRITKASSPSG